MIIFEGDSKAFDAHTTLLFHPNWVISSIISNIFVLKESFNFCLLNWVKIFFNAVAHMATKLFINFV